MRRREFIGLLAVIVASWPAIGLAQVSTKRPLIGVLLGGSEIGSRPWRGALPQGLQELGNIEGRDCEIEYRYAEGDLTRHPALVDELIRAVALQHCPARDVSFGRLLDLQLAAIEWTLGATADSPEARVNEGPSGSAAGNRLRAISRGLEWAFRLYPGPTMASASTRTVTAINEDRAHTIRS